MTIIYNDIHPNAAFEEDLNATYYANLDELLSQADILTLHVPLLPATKHLISYERFKLMKNSALLINTSRGPVIDEAALVQALKNNEIRGAALDVFEDEPALADGLADLPNVVVTPHTAHATIETRAAMAELAARNIVAVLAGQEPETPVTPPPN